MTETTNQNQTKIKICGITNKEDANLSIELGTDAIGFIFYPKSPRYITPEKASIIIQTLPNQPKLLKVGVFVNETIETINHIANLCSLDAIQLHGNESAEFCTRCKETLKSSIIIKAFHIKGQSDIDTIPNYINSIDFLLLDTKTKSEYGGTGKTFNWDIAMRAKAHNIPLFLSGGISDQNIDDAISKVSPEFIDLSSSVESYPGKKDPEKLKKLFKRVI